MTVITSECIAGNQMKPQQADSLSVPALNTPGLTAVFLPNGPWNNRPILAAAKVTYQLYHPCENTPLSDMDTVDYNPLFRPSPPFYLQRLVIST